MKRPFLSIFLICSLMVPIASTPGCKSGPPIVDVMTDVIAVQGDALSVLRILDLAFTEFVGTRVLSPEQMSTYRRIYAEAISALQAGVAICRGIINLSQNQFDQAFSAFRESYDRLIAFLRDVGVIGTDGRVRVTRTSIPIPSNPIVFGYQLRPSTR